MRRFGFFAVFIVLGFVLVFAQENKKEDPFSALRVLKPWEVPYVPLAVRDTVGGVDTLFLDLKKGEREGAWVLHFNLFNDESLFVLAFTLRHDSLMKYDSISLTGSRTDFFQTKIVNQPLSHPNTVTVGLLPALTPEAPPLEPGSGTVLKMFFSAPASRPISIRSVAPLMIPPGLEFATRKGAGVRPAVVRVGDFGPSAPEKPETPAPSKKKPKAKG